MKQYSVALSQPAEGTQEYHTFKYDNELGKTVVTGSIHTRTFYDLRSAKKFIKEHIDTYLSSSITKVYSNGDWEPCGEIKLTGSNAIKMSNMKTYQY